MLSLFYFNIHERIDEIDIVLLLFHKSMYYLNIHGQIAETYMYCMCNTTFPY